MTVIKYDINNKRLKLYFLGVPILRLKCKHCLYRWFVSYRKKCFYKNKLRILCNKSKIRVGFLVSEQAKWSYQSVYDTFLKDSRFEPVVLVTKLYNEHVGKTTYYKTMKDCYNFFKQKGLNVEIAYDEEKKQYLPLDKFGVDVLFYQQPWELDMVQSPFIVSKYAITCYCSYGFDLCDFPESYMAGFHFLLDAFFVTIREVKDYLLTINKHIEKTQLQVVGCPKLDQYITDCKDENVGKQKIIIYAPHHSFEKGSLEMATFQYNGKKILELAKKYKDNIHWIFKPHPRFKHAVIINGVMSEQEINNYYKEWEILGTIYEGGDYINLFKKSDALITDCCSFLAEYLPSEHPVLHLLNSNAKFNNVAKQFINTYYTIGSTEELDRCFTRVIINGDDYKKKDRLNYIKFIFDKNETSADKIVNYLYSQLV